MSRISLLIALNKDGIVKLADQSVFRVAPDELDRTAEWTPGTEIVVQSSNHPEPWEYKLLSSGGGIPVKAAVHSAAA